MWKYHPDLIEVTPQHHYSHYFHTLVFFHIRSACSSFFRPLVTTNRKLTGSSMSESAFSQDERVTRQTIQLRFKITEAKAKESVQEARGPDVEDLKTCGLWPLSLRDSTITNYTTDGQKKPAFTVNVGWGCVLNLQRVNFKGYIPTLKFPNKKWVPEAWPLVGLVGWVPFC